MLFPTSSLRHKGVVLVPQFAQLNAPTELFKRDFPLTAPPTKGEPGVAGCSCTPSITGGLLGSALGPAAGAGAPGPDRDESALLNVGQPEHADVPPVPSHRPSPGHVPAKCAFELAWEACKRSFEEVKVCWPGCSGGDAAGVGIEGDLGDI